MKINKVMTIGIVALLLVVNFLSFHDMWEFHSVKDWLVLGVSILIFGHLALDAVKKRTVG